MATTNFPAGYNWEVLIGDSTPGGPSSNLSADATSSAAPDPPAPANVSAGWDSSTGPASEEEQERRKKIFKICFRLDTRFAKWDDTLTTYVPELGKPFETPAKAGLGDLAALPDEVLAQVLIHLDPKTFAQFRNVNQNARNLATRVPMWQVLVRSSFMAMDGLLASQVGGQTTIESLYHELFTSKCRYCGRLGGYLFLPTAKRICDRCPDENKWCLMMKLEHLAFDFGLQGHTMELFLRKARIFITRQVNVELTKNHPYSFRLESRQLKLVDHESAVQTLESMFQDGILMFGNDLTCYNHFYSARTHSFWSRLFTTPFPVLDERKRTKPVVWCKGCRDATSGASLIPIMPQEEFLAHFEQCDSAQQCWLFPMIEDDYEEEDAEEEDEEEDSFHYEFNTTTDEESTGEEGSENNTDEHLSEEELAEQHRLDWSSDWTENRDPAWYDDHPSTSW